MSHDLTIREDGTAEFFSAVTKGWHNLGHLAESKVTAAEAIKIAQLDWEVEQTEIFHEVGDDFWTVPEHYLVRRKDNHRPLGVHSAKYQVIQNKDAFDFADEIIGSGAAVWDTAGSIGGGRVVFMQVELEGKLFVKNRPDDTTVKKVLFLNSHDGSKALTGLITPIRVVCQNTLNAALGNHSNCFKIKHTRNYQDKKDYAKKVLGLASAYFDDLQAVMDKLAEQTVTQSYIEGFVSALFPSQKAESSTRTENRRQEVVDLINGGKGNLGETRWDVYNGVTEWVDHHSGGRITNTRLEKSGIEVSKAQVEMESRFERALLGSGASVKQRALDLLLN